MSGLLTTEAIVNTGSVAVKLVHTVAGTYNEIKADDVRAKFDKKRPMVHELSLHKCFSATRKSYHKLTLRS